MFLVSARAGILPGRAAPPAAGSVEDMVLLAHIRAQFSTSNETYGAPRMHAELKEDGLDVGRHRVARLMRDNGLKALQKRRYKKTTDSGHGGPVAANLLDQDFRLRRSRSEVGRRHQLHLDGRGLALSGDRA